MGHFEPRSRTMKLERERLSDARVDASLTRTFVPEGLTTYLILRGGAGNAIGAPPIRSGEATSIGHIRCIQRS